MTCVIQYEDRRDDQHEELMAYNAAYCRKQGYTYYRPFERIDIPPCWIKVLLVKQVMVAHPDVQTIAWLDSDAVVHDTARRIETLFPADKDLLLSYCPLEIGDLNTGVFYIRVNDTTRQVVNDWWNCYTTTSWNKVGGKWTCDGPQTGLDYERGAFTEKVLPRYPDVVGKYVYTIFNESVAFPNPSTFSCHFLFPKKDKKTLVTRYLVARKVPSLIALCVVGLGIGVYAYYRRQD